MPFINQQKIYTLKTFQRCLKLVYQQKHFSKLGIILYAPFIDYSSNVVSALRCSLTADQGKCSYAETNGSSKRYVIRWISKYILYKALFFVTFIVALKIDRVDRTVNILICKNRKMCIVR